MDTKDVNNPNLILIEGQTFYLDPNNEGAMEKPAEANKWGLRPVVKDDTAYICKKQEPSADKTGKVTLRKAN